jgi:hypothetical protein
MPDHHTVVVKLTRRGAVVVQELGVQVLALVNDNKYAVYVAADTNQLRLMSRSPAQNLQPLGDATGVIDGRSVHSIAVCTLQPNNPSASLHALSVGDIYLAPEAFGGWLLQIKERKAYVWRTPLDVKNTGQFAFH